jgi:hypothetical protein
MAASSVSFASALAPEWEQVDLLTPGGERQVHGTLAAVLTRAARSDGRRRSLMTRSMVTRGESGEPLAAGLHVSLAERPGMAGFIPWATFGVAWPG